MNEALDYSFTEQEMQAAYDSWGANCGPSSLAFALQLKLDEVRYKIPGFEEKRYTSPTMMKAALANLGKTFTVFPADVANMFRVTKPWGINLVRVQWTGPWTAPGANAKWAYRQTHWIATWAERESLNLAGDVARIGSFVFDCNGGIGSFDRWEKEIVPIIIGEIKRADGGWFPTHVWRIDS